MTTRRSESKPNATCPICHLPTVQSGDGAWCLQEEHRTPPPACLKDALDALAVERDKRVTERKAREVAEDELAAMRERAERAEAEVAAIRADRDEAERDVVEVIAERDSLALQLAEAKRVIEAVTAFRNSYAKGEPAGRTFWLHHLDAALKGSSK